MTLQQLRYAVCIAKNKSMNKAAAELFISQPSLSVTIRDLEELTSSQTTNQIFVMLEAIARKQREKVLTLYYDLIELKESPFGILALLVRQCNQRSGLDDDVLFHEFSQVM